MDIEQRKNDSRDSKRAFRWGVIAVIVLVLGALAANFILGNKEGERLKQEASQGNPVVIDGKTAK
ncbi:hypothetical protein VARIO8X_90087 [Burkholderiales bacterium 8X]|nr:hypothetical protein VARIO8X_90087 [Burkholderiales bacterium 8X]